MFQHKQLYQGFIVAAPISIAVGLYGLVMGVMAAAQGLSWLELLVKSFAVFAGASQFVVVERWGSPIWVLLVATAAVNLRYLMVGLSLRDLLDEARWPLRLASLWYAADENWALTLARRTQDARIGASFLLGSGLAVLLFWQAGGQLGLAFGNQLRDPQGTIDALGFDFAFPAIFLALTLSFIKGALDWLAVGAAAAVSVGLYVLIPTLIPSASDFHDLYIIGGALAGCLVCALTYVPPSSSASSSSPSSPSSPRPAPPSQTGERP